MSPEKARVCLINDDKDLREVIADCLKLEGHQVVLTTSTLSETLTAISLFREKGVQVALIDGNLTPGDTSGSDGATIARAIKAQAPEVKTIGTSVLGHVAGVDINLRPSYRMRYLLKAVTQI